MLVYKNGDIFKSGADVILNQVNCQGVYGLGMAGQIKRLYPKACEEYKDLTAVMNKKVLGDTSKILGSVVISQSQNPWIVHLYGQDNYGRNMRYTDYAALRRSIKLMKENLLPHASKEGFVIAIPHCIGCGNAGGDWDVVHEILLDELDSYVCEVQIWKL